MLPCNSYSIACHLISLFTVFYRYYVLSVFFYRLHSVVSEGYYTIIFWRAERCNIRPEGQLNAVAQCMHLVAVSTPLQDEAKLEGSSYQMAASVELAFD